LITLLCSICFISATRPKVEVQSGDTTCVLCEFIVKQLEDIIGNNNTQQNVINALSKVCNILPKVVRSQCTNFIQQNGQLLIQILIDKLAPHTACVKLKMCSSFSVAKFLPSPVSLPKSGDNNLCPMCQLFVTLVENYLSMNTTIGFIENILHNFPCKAFFGGNMEQQCEQFVDQYVPQLIDWIVKIEPFCVFCLLICLFYIIITYLFIIIIGQSISSCVCSGQVAYESLWGWHGRLFFKLHELASRRSILSIVACMSSSRVAC